MLHRVLFLTAASVFVLASNPTPAMHCDGLDGPVVLAAQKALDSGNINHVLIWVQKKDEGEIRKAYEATVVVRKGSPKAKEVADQFFFETVVRVHRAGEGASFTGLKPAGRDLGPAVPAADRAVANGAADPLLKLVREAVEHGLKERLEEVLHRKSFDPNDVEAGRDYVKSYVEFIHYVERLYEDAKGPAHGHFPEGEEHHK